MKTTCIFFGIFALFLFNASLFGQLPNDRAVLGRFLQEAPHAWRSARKAMAEKELSSKTESYDILDGNKVPGQIVERNVRQRDDMCFLIEGKSYGKLRGTEPTAFWVIGNHFYTATLVRRETASESSFFSQALVPRNEEFPERSNPEVFNWRLYPTLYPGYQFHDACLFDCFVNFENCFSSQKTFNYEVVDAILEKDEVGRELVNLILKQVYKTEKGWEENQGASVEIKLIPEKNWALAEFKLKSKATIAGSSSNELDLSQTTICYYDMDSIHPIKIVEEMKLGIGTSCKEVTLNATLGKPLSCSDCRLPAFGLKEPEDLVPKSDGWIYIGLVLGVLAFFGIFFYLRKTK